MYIVTTCLRPTEELNDQAKSHASTYERPLVDRRKHSVRELMTRHGQAVMVFDKRRIEFYPLGSEEAFFFHPSSSVFRIKQLQRGGSDPLVEAGLIRAGDAVLDCTLGLGADSIVMSHQVGPNGRIVGVESEWVTAFLVAEGLKRWQEKEEAINEAMRRIDVKQGDALAYLRTCPDRSFDVVYLDPMFERTITESVHLDPLRKLANTAPLTDELLAEARRVADRRVVLKAHYESEWFERYGFVRNRRKTSKFHYGYIDVSDPSSARD